MGGQGAQVYSFQSDWTYMYVFPASFSGSNWESIALGSTLEDLVA